MGAGRASTHHVEAGAGGRDRHPRGERFTGSRERTDLPEPDRLPVTFPTARPAVLGRPCSAISPSGARMPGAADPGNGCTSRCVSGPDRRRGRARRHRPREHRRHSASGPGRRTPGRRMNVKKRLRELQGRAGPGSPAPSACTSRSTTSPPPSPKPGRPRLAELQGARKVVEHHSGPGPKRSPPRARTHTSGSWPSSTTSPMPFRAGELCELPTHEASVNITHSRLGRQAVLIKPRRGLYQRRT